MSYNIPDFTSNQQSILVFDAQWVTRAKQHIPVSVAPTVPPVVAVSATPKASFPGKIEQKTEQKTYPQFKDIFKRPVLNATPYSMLKRKAGHNAS